MLMARRLGEDKNDVRQGNLGQGELVQEESDGNNPELSARNLRRLVKERKAAKMVAKANSSKKKVKKAKKIVKRVRGAYRIVSVIMAIIPALPFIVFAFVFIIILLLLINSIAGITPTEFYNLIPDGSVS